jgi:AcrR family transcriptional regulator
MAEPRPRSSASPGSAAPRERILLAASSLFGRRGAARTGVDAIIAEADVAKATFYRHFPTKEALVVAWLRSPGTRWFDHLRPAVEAGADPEDRLNRLVAAVADWLDAGDYRGCPYLNMATEAEDGRPAATAVREYLDEIGAYFQGLAASAGHAQPELAGRQLQTILAGSISLGVAHRTSRYVASATAVAREVLAAG